MTKFEVTKVTRSAMRIDGYDVHAVDAGYPGDIPTVIGTVGKSFTGGWEAMADPYLADAFGYHGPLGSFRKIPTRRAAVEWVRSRADAICR